MADLDLDVGAVAARRLSTAAVLAPPFSIVISSGMSCKSMVRSKNARLRPG